MRDVVVRQSLVFLDMPALQQHEMYIGGAPKQFDSEGRLTNDDTCAAEEVRRRVCRADRDDYFSPE